MRVTVETLTRPPRLRLVSPPGLDAEAEDAVGAARARIAAAPYLFDGPTLIALEAGPKEIVAYEASYAHYEAGRDLGHLGQGRLGLGRLGVGLVLRNDAGQTLWGLRSAYVKQPGSWWLAASGGAVAGRSLRESLLAEVRDEIGLPKKALADLEARALVTGPYPVGCYVVFEATLARGYEPRPDKREVDELRFVAAPERELSKIDAASRLVWWELSERLAPTSPERRRRRPTAPAFAAA